MSVEKNTKRYVPWFRGQEPVELIYANPHFQPECVSAGILMLTYMV